MCKKCRKAFLSLLWLWDRKFLDGASMSILDFVDWLDALMGQRVFFSLYPFLCQFGASVYPVCTLISDAPFFLVVTNNILVCL